MSKKWKIVIGVVAVAVVSVGIALSIWGIVTFRSRGHERGWMPGAYRRGPEVATQLEVELVDDDGDGVPDRGVIDIPTAAAFGPGRGRHFGYAQGRMHFGRGFGPGGGLPYGSAFGPFLIVGGLARLAFLALLIGAAILFLRRRCWARPPAPNTPQQEK